VVSLIEFFGVLLTIMLITLVAWRFGVGDLQHWQGWQKDCGVIAGILFLIAVVILLTTVALVLVMLRGGTWLRNCRPIVAEGVILAAFIVNIVAFCVAISRSGGPSHSFFTQLVPMQLSGILILEQQKASMTNRKSGARRRSCYYAAFAIVVWLVSAPYSIGVVQMGGGNYEDFVASFLFVLGVLVSVAAFVIPPRLAARWKAQRT
jgi:hypothetical protein